MHFFSVTFYRSGLEFLQLFMKALTDLTHWFMSRAHSPSFPLLHLRHNSAGNRRRFTDEWIGPPGDVTTSGYLRFNRQLVSYTIVAHWITSTRACVYDLASGGNSSDKLGTSRVTPPTERRVPKSASSYRIWKYLVKILRIYLRN